MSNKSPEEKDVLFELLKKLWQPIVGFLGAIIFAYNFYKMWLGDQETVTYFTAGGGLIVLVIVLGWIGLSKKTIIYKKKTKSEPRYSTNYRRIAFVFLGIVVIGSVLGGGLLYKNSMSQAEATEKKIIVLVAQFDGPEKTYGLRDQIMEELHKVAKGNNDVVVIDSKETITSGQGSDYARDLGEKEKADLVIWAWYKPIDNPNIHIHFENLSTTQIQILKSSETYEPQATLADLKSFEVQQKIGSEAKTLISFISAMASYRLGDYQKALNSFESIFLEKNVSTYIDPIALYFYIGNSYLFLGAYERSIENYDHLLILNPNDVDAYNNRGLAYSYLKDYDRAVQDFDKYIELNPNDVAAYGNRGNVYYDLGDCQQAVQNYEKVISLEPSDYLAYNNSGNAYTCLKDYHRAIQAFDKAMGLNSNNALAYNNRGNTYYILKDYDRALQDFNKAIELDPKFAVAYSNRGNAYAALKDYDHAVGDYDKAVQLDPKYSPSYNNRGFAYAVLKDYERAIQDFDKAIQLNPSYADAYNGRRIAYQNLGKTTEAEADFAKYKELTGQASP